MKRSYPYLHDKYFTNTETEDKVSRSILRDIEEFVNQRQYIRLTLLDWKENPIREIQGEVSSGSLSKVAQSPVRRSGSLSVAVDANSYSVDDAEADFAINKKIYIELGVRNDTNKYPEYPIFWFPEGVFFIGSFAINSSSTGSTNINLTLKDKMAMLNGEIGGVLPAMVTFDTMETQLPDGTYVTKKVLIYSIIQELVNHYGKENLTNIVIEDVPKRIRRILKWSGDKPLYLKWKATNSTGKNSINLGTDGYKPTFTLKKPGDDESNWETFYAGDDIGYTRENFVITKELVGNAGETVCSILDKIVNILGNYEYFYDVYGIFHFREIKNYMNHTLGEKVLSELAEKDYLVDTNNSKNVFSFSDETLLTSITVTPLYENIKNDFIIDGLNKNDSTGVSRNIRYHLAIDTKPRPIGIDKREKIKILWDREADKALIKEDISNLNTNLELIRDEKSRALANIETLRRRKLQRYDYLRKYGDDLKYRLSTVLGEYSKPDNQDLSLMDNVMHSGGEDEDGNEIIILYILTFEDFYESLFEDLIKEMKKQNKKNIDINLYLNKWDQRMIELIKANIEEEKKTYPEIDQYFQKGSTKTREFSQKIYDFLRPEGYWRIIKSGILADIFKEKEKVEYKSQLKAWYQAQSKITGLSTEDIPLLEEAFGKLEADYKNPITGYLKVSENCIKTNQKVSIKKPEGNSGKLTSAEELPGTLKKLFQDNANPDHIFNNDAKTAMKKIYSEYYTCLANNNDQDDLDLKNNIEIRKKVRTNKLNIKSKKTAAEKLKNNWVKYDSKKVKTLRSFSYYSYTLSNNEENTILERRRAGAFSNRQLSFQRVEEKILKYTKKYMELNTQEQELTKIIKVLKKKTSKNRLEDIWNYLIPSWESYKKEISNIKEIDDKIEEYQQKYKGKTVFNGSEIQEIIEKLQSANLYIGKENSEKISIFPGTIDDNGEITLEEGAAEETISQGLKEKEIFKNIISSISTTDPKTIDKEKFYTNLISYLEGYLDVWEKNPNYIIAENPRQGHFVYHIFTDKTMVLYKEPNTGIIKAGFVYDGERPTIGNFNLIYESNEKKDLRYFYWDGKVYQPLEVKGIYFCEDTIKKVANDKSNFSAQNFINRTSLKKVGSAYYIYDWRTFLYLQGLYAKIEGTDKGHYFEELEAFWPETYDLVEQRFRGQPEEEENGSSIYSRTKFTNGYYFLDFLDSVETTLGKWSVDNIGRRSDVVHKEDVNCLFEPEIPNVNILNASSKSMVPEKEVYTEEDEWSLERLRKESINNGEPYSQVSDEIYENIYTGGYRNSAYEQIKYELYLHTRYQKTISMSSIPVFYLEPNSRITVADKTTNTFGDFIIQSINLTFGPGANMSISANETLERF